MKSTLDIRILQLLLLAVVLNFNNDSLSAAYSPSNAINQRLYSRNTSRIRPHSAISVSVSSSKSDSPTNFNSDDRRNQSLEQGNRQKFRTVNCSRASASIWRIFLDEKCSSDELARWRKAMRRHEIAEDGDREISNCRKKSSSFYFRIHRLFISIGYYIHDLLQNSLPVCCFCLFGRVRWVYFVSSRTKNKKINQNRMRWKIGWRKIPHPQIMFDSSDLPDR